MPIDIYAFKNDVSTALILTEFGVKNAFRRPLRTGLSIVGIALCVTLMLTTAAITSRYTAVVSETSSIYNSNLVVVSKSSLLIEGLPLGGTLPETIVPLVRAVHGVTSATPILVTVDFSRLVPSNVTIGIPLQNFSMFGRAVPLTLRGAYPYSNRQVLVGSYLSGVSNLTVGSTLKEANVGLEVSGVISTSNAVLDDAVIMSLDTAQSIQGYSGLISAVLVDFGGVGSADITGNVTSFAPGVAVLQPNSGGLSRNPLVSSIGSITAGVDAFSALLAVLFASVISIVNLVEQKDELATLGDMGSPTGKILRITTAETGFMVLVGVVLGSVLAFLSTVFIFLLYAGLPFSTAIASALASVPLLTVLASCLGLVAVGVVVGALTTSRILGRSR